MPVLMPELLVAAANALLGAADDGAHDALTERMLKTVRFAQGGEDAELDGVRAPFDAALVHYLGYWSHYSAADGESSWPLPATGECADLARFGRTHGLLADEPAPGDIFLLWSPARKIWMRSGIVMSAKLWVEEEGRGPAFLCQTVEGDSDARCRLGGAKALRHERTLSTARGDRFVRWALSESSSTAVAWPPRLKVAA